MNGRVRGMTATMLARDAARAFGCLPTFLVIGAMKAGTSSLYHYLRVHPGVYMPAAKELSFFARDPKGGRSLDWYRRQFAGAAPWQRAIGEASTMYSRYPLVRGVPERVSAQIPHAKLIYIVRDPIERIRSHYEHRVSVGTERAPLQHAVLENPVYLDCSRYAMQVERYLPVFPREQLLLITSEELRHRRRETMAHVYGFLNVDTTFVPGNIDKDYYRSDERIPYPPMLWRIRRSLKKHVPITRHLRVGAIPPMRGFGRLYRRTSASGQGVPTTVSPELREIITDSLADDLQRLRHHMPPTFDAWGLL
jgi:hypothetical protein